MISREETRQAAWAAFDAGFDYYDRAPAPSMRSMFLSGWDAALAVQATETETLKAELAKDLMRVADQVEYGNARTAYEDLRVIVLRLTDLGTSPSQDAQEPT